MLPDLAAACRKSGLQVFEMPGWERRTRPASTGTFDPRGVLCHHTGSSRDDTEFVEWMATVGRSDLPAPLCQLALGRDGTVYVVAAGRANHGGTAKASGPMPSGDANSLYIGIEAMNTGSEGWGERQYDAYVRLCAALCKHYGWPATHVRAHKETSVTGKWDPGELDMDKFRRDIATHMKDGDDMPYTDWPQADRDALVADIRKALHGGEQSRYQRLRDLIKRKADASKGRERATLDAVLAEDERA